MANSYSFDQIASVLNSIVADAQGRTADISTTPRNTYEFVTMATRALSMGTDPVTKSISQLINKTVFASRPYRGKFDLMNWGEIEWGNAVRKLTPVDANDAQNTLAYDAVPADGASVDQWIIKRPKTLQMQFIGADQYQIQEPTVFLKQFNSAFRNPEELAQFLSMQTQHVLNQKEQDQEQLARMTVANFIGAKINVDSGNVIKLLTEYNTATGQSLTATTVYAPDNFEPFIEWAFSRIEQISKMMTERTVNFHMSPTGYTVLRHTPLEYQRFFVYSGFMTQVRNIVRSGLYNEGLLKMIPYEEINFWQNVNSPMAINIIPAIMTEGGTVSRPSKEVSQNNIIGVLFDRDAMGINYFADGVRQTTVNARSPYYNTFHDVVRRYCNDLTENGVVFLLA